MAHCGVIEMYGLGRLRNLQVNQMLQTLVSIRIINAANFFRKMVCVCLCLMNMLLCTYIA